MSNTNTEGDLQNLSPKTKIIYKPGAFRYQDLPSDDRRRMFYDRQAELNPCLKESDIVNACLVEAGDDHQQCYAQVENYKTCKKFWNAVRAFATSNNLLRNDGYPPLVQRPIWKKQLHTWIQTKKLTIPDEIKPLV